MTRVFGVLGFPVTHSLSPVMHAAAFEALGLDALYAPFEVPPSQLARVLRGLVACGIDGLNVTVPLKEAIVPHLNGLEGDARVLRAVNTIVIRSGRLIGHNTDVAGFARALRELGWRPRPSTAVLLGAGGAAKAAAWALTQTPGMRLMIANRHLARARRLADWLQRARPGCRTQTQGLREVDLRGCDLLVNATSVGMRAGDAPVPLTGLTKRMMVYDLVYNRPTPLVRMAQRKGCVASGGASMLVYQGAEAFRLWWRREPPVDAMRRAVERALR